MSRTTRRRPYGYNPGEFRHEEAKAEENPWKAFERQDLYHNRDYGCFSEVYDGSKRSPKGYCTWSSVANGHRRKAKRMSARVIRARGKDEIRRDLSAD